MPKLNRQERIFALIKRLGFSNLQKHQIVKTRYNRKHICHLTAAQGIDLENALTEVVERDTLEAFNLLSVKQDTLWTDNPLFSVPVEYARL